MSGGRAAGTHYLLNVWERRRVTKARNDIVAEGTVKLFNSDKGNGFISPDDGTADMFAHYSEIATSGRRDLFENQRVEFEVGPGKKGPQATNIRPL